MSGLNEGQVEDLLDYLGTPKRTSWKGGKIQFCCTVHGETHPSCGINIDYTPSGSFGKHLQVFHCLSCGAKGSLPWLVYKSLPEEFKSLKQAEKFMKERYGVDYYSSTNKLTSTSIRRYEDLYDSRTVGCKRLVLPRTKLALFKSGKETYQYFFDRGFNKKDMQYFGIGRDLDNQTVTIPDFWEDGTLAGVIGRFISRKRAKNERYKIYGYEKGQLIYPLDKLKTLDDTLIGVEGMIDAMMMHKWGMTNTCAIKTNGMTKEQAKQIRERCKKFIALFDNDEGGRKGIEIAKSMLGNSVMILTPQYYPIKGKDPTEWGEEETRKVIDSASYLGTRKIPRL